MKRRLDDEAPPESDALEGTPHPRHVYDFFGHSEVEQDLLDAYRTGRLPQSIILAGPEGIGKATLAWRFARFLFAHPEPALPAVRNATSLAVAQDHPVCHRIESLGHGDLSLLRREWNADTKKHRTEIRVDDVRVAIEMFHQASAEGGWRICIVDSADDLNRNSANALLKIIEEPPDRSLFIFVSHLPGRILPTIRSRSRLIRMQPLDVEDVTRAILAIGEDFEGQGERIRDAAELSEGSVRQTIRLLDTEGQALSSEIDNILQALPRIEWSAIHRLSDRVSGSTPTALDDFAATIETIQDWLAAQVRAGAAAGQGAANLAPYAQVWDKVAAAVRETEAINLDKRPLILSIFADLAAAVGAARP